MPTEAEWLYATRGGNKTKDYTYFGGNNLDHIAWYKDNSNAKLHEVGQKLSNELGIYDMTGNVWEWCEDTYKDNNLLIKYDDLTLNNPINNTGEFIVARGGAYNNELPGYFYINKYGNSNVPWHGQNR